MTDKKRVGIATALGAFLGIFCIIGVGWRLGYTGNEWYLLGMWYNRVIMGAIIGFAGWWTLIPGPENWLKNSALRGLILGIIITSAIAITTAFKDVPSWFAGIAYGVIIDIATTYITKK
ncbi:hypothetical protein [Methanonatronarchaeum sp. AMET6-2]|uniref:hypothetical protein n=1 Tax=Methanonatronarchaeum sp. AMET6-2 TaxID=2933293 RepID=UPI001201C1F1|nr:hypothetical protein [Methanonatronarchaeum sp. AMET6-2]RZN63346.1 MAG: hypothetical protein EF811_00405 [Methanonatronarchaeia archaeon]UOY10594.1 hypothetical protein MU439_02855 [Methanonatronarchaeum sp. AMET6-2]